MVFDCDLMLLRQIAPSAITAEEGAEVVFRLFWNNIN
jgi:hypothetical protein